MKKIVFILKIALFVTLFVVSSSNEAQILNNNFNQVKVQPIAQKILDAQNEKRNFTECILFHKEKGLDLIDSLRKELDSFTVLKIQESEVKKLLASRPEYLELTLPNYIGCEIKLLLKQNTIIGKDLSVSTSSGEKIPLDETKGIHYWGIVNGELDSYVALSIFENEVMGIISSGFGNIVVGKIRSQDKYIIYNDVNLKREIPFICGTDEMIEETTKKNIIQDTRQTNTINTVDLYWEMNYDIYLDKGSVGNTINFATGIFNQVQLLYSNDGITVSLSSLVVWDTPSPYGGSTSAQWLTSFENNLESFDGDLANLITYSNLGGIAHVNGLCSSWDNRKCFSGINNDYSFVPEYSWTVQVITHEQGHVMASWHTHDCVWNNNSTAIDGCGPAAGYPPQIGSCANGPIPTMGTIMSYCHLSPPNPGIDFSLGFGPQPANLIITTINNAPCLVSSSVLCDNDNCNDAITLYSNTSCQNTLCSVDNATPDNFPDQASCDDYTGNILGAGVFFKFTASSTTHTITVVPTGNLDAVLVLYSGGCYVLNEIGCNETIGTGSATLTVNNLTINQEYTIRVYDYGAVNATSGGFNICVTHTNICNLSVTPSNQNVAYTAGNTNFNVTSNCAWSAVSSDPSWCTVTPSGSGSATLAATFTQNPNTYSRVATITVTASGVSPVYVTVTQAGSTACNLSVTPSNQNVAYTAGNTNFNVTSNCPWSAVSSDPLWCTVTSSGSGNGTITATYTQNPNSSNRVATITITASGVTPVYVTVTQAGSTACNLSVTPSNRNVPYTAGNTNFSVTSNCAWNAVSSDPSWCTVTSSGYGNGEIIANYTQNSGTNGRIAYITVTSIGTIPIYVTVTQAGSPACNLSVTPSNRNVLYTAGNTSFNVTSNCAWNAVSSDPSWCTVTSSGSGNGTITATYTQNPNSSNRLATITITATGVTPVYVTVTQAGLTACNLSVTPSNQNIPSSGGNTNYSVTSNCAWTAVSSDPSWCTVTPSGSGNGTLIGTCTQNMSTNSRVTTITVSALGVIPKYVTITQAGSQPTCTLSILPTNQNVLYTAGNTNFDVTSNCVWNAISSDPSWCSITSTGNGNGTILATYVQNPNTYNRIATITITVSGLAPLNVTLTQAGQPIGQKPVALFTSNIQSGIAPLSVQFNDQSQNNPTSWLWQFGDGYSSILQNPTYIYNNTGTYTVSLTASNQFGQDVETKIGYIIIENGQNYYGCDTLKFPLTGQLVIQLASEDSGYVVGNNQFKDKAVAEYFNNSSSNMVISGLVIEFGVAKQKMNNNEQISFLIWKENQSSGGPSTILGTKLKALSDLVNDVNQQKLSTVEFDNLIHPEGSFFAGFTLPKQIGDTLCLVSTLGNDHHAVNTTWIQEVNNTWSSVDELWNNQGNPLKISSTIFPKTCLVYGIDEQEVKHTYSIWPNPCHDFLYISNDRQEGSAKYYIIDIFGRIIKGGIVANSDIKAVDVSELIPSLYFLHLTDEAGDYTAKIIIH